MSPPLSDNGSTVIHNIPYSSSNNPKQSLDLYQPSKATNTPVLIFIHGGGWTEGDKNLEVDGHRIYEDIGNIFARAGILTAVINYRLIPVVSWREQLRDVAAAVSWVRDHAAEYGGDASRLFVSGHSAGAQLAARVALDPDLLGGKKDVAGVIAVSGAGYEIEKRLSYYARRFQGKASDDQWPKEASILRFVDSGSPPFLILYGSKEPRDFREQALKLSETCAAQGVPAKLIEIPDQNHFETAEGLSRDDGLSVKAMLEFMR